MKPRPHPSLPQKRPTAFTLIELLVVVGTIVILTAFFLSASASVQNRANAAKVNHSFNQIAGAIKSFEQDWGQLPNSTSELISVSALKSLAAIKGVALAPTKPYLTGIPEVDGLAILTKWYCPDYLADPVTNAKHTHDESTHDGDTCMYYFAVNGNGFKDHNVTLTSITGLSPSSGAEKRVGDAFGNMIYYLKMPNGSYLLVSPGPDKKIGSGNGTLAEWESHTANYKGAAAEDKDNIVFKSNV